MSISFPKVTFNILSAINPAENQSQKVLFVGQKTSAGTAPSGGLVQNIPNDKSWDTAFGVDSMLAAMLRSARGVNAVTQFDAIPLSDAGLATASVGTIAFTGPASAAGTLKVYVGSSVNHAYEIVIAVADTATVIGAALAAAINADTASTVNAVNTLGSVALTAVNLGEEGNTISLRVLGSVAGVGATLTAMAGGTVNPDLTTLFDVITGIRYQTIVFPSTYDTADLVDYLDDNFNVDNAIMDGVGIQSITDTYANLLILGNSLNSNSLRLDGHNLVVGNPLYSGSSLFELGYVISSNTAAIRSLRLTDGANISSIVTATVSAADTIGGPAIASLPYANTPYSQLPIIDNGLEFTQIEIDSLKDAGITVISNNLSRTSIINGEAVTTYKFDSAGNPDPSFKFLNYVDTLSNIREFYFRSLKNRFSQSRLTTGDIQPGRTMVNQEMIEAYCIELYVTLSEQDFVLTVAGEDALNFYKRNLNVSLDLSEGLVTIFMQTPIVTQLREFIGSIRLSFNAQS